MITTKICYDCGETTILNGNRYENMLFFSDFRTICQKCKKILPHRIIEEEDKEE